jgi:hypothetical protein
MNSEQLKQLEAVTQKYEEQYKIVKQKYIEHQNKYNEFNEEYDKLIKIENEYHSMENKKYTNPFLPKLFTFVIYPVKYKFSPRMQFENEIKYY